MHDLSDFRPGPGCFWNSARDFFGVPNIHWCEASRCSIIEQPATTWSNLAYIAVALYVLARAAGEREPARARALAFAVLATGLFSFVYHASNNFLTQALDFVGMYLYTGLLILFNFRRLGLLATVDARRNAYLALLGGNLALLLLFQFALGVMIQYTVLLNILAIIGQEFAIRARVRRAGGALYGMKFFGLAIGTIFLAEACSLADGLRLYCVPENAFLHGHALWHLFGGLSTLFSFFFYRQFGAGFNSPSSGRA